MVHDTVKRLFLPNIQNTEVDIVYTAAKRLYYLHKIVFEQDWATKTARALISMYIDQTYARYFKRYRFVLLSEPN